MAWPDGVCAICNGAADIRMTLLAVRSASRSAGSDGDETFIVLEH